jgi:hypothetical protein
MRAAPAPLGAKAPGSRRFCFSFPQYFTSPKSRFAPIMDPTGAVKICIAGSARYDTALATF